MTKAIRNGRMAKLPKQIKKRDEREKQINQNKEERKRKEKADGERDKQIGGDRESEKRREIKKILYINLVREK